MNRKRLTVAGRGDYISNADFISKYYLNIDNCREFFFNMKWPYGYVCEKCGCTHYYFMSSKGCYRCKHCHHDERLLTNTCFQDCKLPLNILLYGMFLIFTDKRGISSVELAEELKVNYKTACLLQSKCCILMKSSNSRKSLDSIFYESDISYIGAPSEGKRGMSTDKQAYLIVLSSGKENQYPEFIKIKEVDTDSGKNILDLFTNFVKMDKNRLLNTDGKTTYNVLKPYINVKNRL